ncbi:MAG: zinc-ribbon domain-containing protein [Pseudodesulfovibrio sp.]
MEIICPDCKFSREVDETKVPARSQVATCPKCQVKFKFRELPDEEPLEEKPTEAAPIQEEEPVLKPWTNPSAAEPRPETPPAAKEDTDPVFPPLSAPGEDPKEGLWDKLGDMTPPEAMPKAVETTPEAPQPIQETQEPVPGWNGEFSDSFPDPMHGDVESENEENASPLVPPPFEQLDRYGFFHGLYMTIKLVLKTPRLFFAVMPVGGGLAKPLTFAILLSMIQAFAQLAFGATGLVPGIDINNQEILENAYNLSNGVFELLFTPAVVAVTLFFTAGFYHLILIVLKADNKGFEGTFRAVAYASAPIITGIIPMVSFEVLSVWMAIYAIWGLVLTTIGLRYIHRISYAKVIPVVLMPLLVGLIAGFMLLQGQMPTI